MSGSSFSRAQDVGARAAAWLEQRERGPWSEEDQASFDAWLEESFAHQTAYWRVEEAWGRADRLRVLSRPKDDSEISPARSWPLMFRIAAVLGVAAVIGVATLRYFQITRTETYTTPVGAREFLTLADGSQITLNTNTTLRITADQRSVWLDKGEAYFQIKHDAAHPFTVTIGDRRVTDLGTSFVVRRDSGRIDVALVEGAARFGARDGQLSQSLLLAPGDEVTATAESMSVAKKAASDLADRLGWRRGVLVFRHTTLAEAVAEFNRYNRSQIVLGDPETAKLTVSGTFPANDLNPFTEVVQSVFRLRVAKNGGDVVLLRR